MKKFMFMCTLFGGLILAATVQAGNHYRKSPEYQKIDTQARANLQECLNNKNHSIESCIEKTEKSIKMQKKQLKKELKNHSNS